MILIASLVAVVLVSAAIGLVYSYQTSRRPENRRFASGSYPQVPLDGKYRGSWLGQRTNWQGKEFDASTAGGLNNFSDGQRYRFKTLASPSIANSSQTVLRIDYNLAENPWWLRRIVDELVEVELGKYQGKVYLKYLPGLTFTISYFSLEK